MAANIIATEPLAARAAEVIFARGGNAADAAAAASLACTVLEPSAVDIGGYVAAGVILEGATDRVWSLDANSVAPAAASETMYEVLGARTAPRGINELEYDCTVRDDANVYGALSVGVPGFLAGVGTLWERWGSLPWVEIVRPALECCANLHYGLVRKEILFKQDVIARFPETARILLPGGRVPDADAQWDRPDLVNTLEQIATAGWRDLYTGELARTLVDYVRAEGGILTMEDMAGFAPRITEPLTGRYREATLHTAIAPNGGFTVLDALHQFETPHAPLRYEQAEDWVRLIEVLRASWAGRLDTRSPHATPGTVHVAASDLSGTLISMTISQGGWFGSCMAVPGTGIIPGHGMCRFDPHPGLANSPGPGKRPLNNVCPMILRQPHRDVAIGLRGGRRIVSVALQMAQRLIDLDASVEDVLRVPRLHTIDGSTVEVSRDFAVEMRDALRARGYNIVTPDEVGGAAYGVEIRR
ncbi:MAG: gamma-glutamyltransferase [Acidobacteria bacterium]|nr:gamma-glutamyltransferase [Acidobacteriota bacterium]